MTTIEAHQLTFKKIKELEKSGISVEIKPSKSRESSEMIKKYNNPGRVPPEYWFFVTFFIDNNAQAMKIHEAANYLGMCGITFDTGGCCNYRDWELDWSFRYTGVEDEKWRDARDSVEDMILHMDEN